MTTAGADVAPSVLSPKDREHLQGNRRPLPSWHRTQVPDLGQVLRWQTDVLWGQDRSSVHPQVLKFDKPCTWGALIFLGMLALWKPRPVLRAGGVSGEAEPVSTDHELSGLAVHPSAPRE